VVRANGTVGVRGLSESDQVITSTPRPNGLEDLGRASTLIFVHILEESRTYRCPK
jgi:hypothetical protein